MAERSAEFPALEQHRRFLGGDVPPRQAQPQRKGALLGPLCPPLPALRALCPAKTPASGVPTPPPQALPRPNPEASLLCVEQPHAVLEGTAPLAVVPSLHCHLRTRQLQPCVPVLAQPRPPHARCQVTLKAS
jgi:hypothetical protein